MNSLSEKINHYLDERGDLAPEEWYAMWYEWLKTLIHVPLEQMQFSCSTDDALYIGSSKHMEDHPKAFNLFLQQVQQRIHEWIDTMLNVIDRHPHIYLEVFGASTDMNGEYQGYSYHIQLHELLIAHAFSGKNLIAIPYNSSVGRLIHMYNTVQYQEAAWTTFMECKSHNAWSDQGLIFEYYNQQQGRLPGKATYSSFENMRQDKKDDQDDRERYALWQKERTQQLRNVAWYDLPEVYRECETWRKMLSLSMVHSGAIDATLFPDLPDVCRDVLSNMITAYTALTTNLDFSRDDILPVLLNMLPSENILELDASIDEGVFCHA